MPIYEFYCPDCHTLFSFLSRAVDTTARPPCPRCRQRLERRPSTFATPRRGRGDEADEGPLAGVDEERMEEAMESVLGELEGAEEGDDPRQMARLLRRFGEAAGMEPGPRMEDLLGRLEAGEDPDGMDSELGDDDLAGEAGDDDLFRRKREARRARRAKPRVDDELYFL